MNTTTGFLIAVLLLTALSASHSARPDSDSDSASPFSAELKKKSKGASGGGNYGPGGGFNIPGVGTIPGFGNGIIGGGYGAGYGGPSGGYSRGGVIRPTVTCTDHGPCYQKKLTCPEKCFSSYSRSGKNYGGGGGGGGCTMDCKKKCVAYC
ncbi:hypothetical protein MRB53_014328 [Persea americana]|uniref:Uncharacterized protein n=1 Tax=Persea americana TaxID=3435 RepID=A0ACC2KAZ5_PERAE|nr:hypothetical protein MRB53_014328 [Persea americana]|eukprot:TRINITY_DN25183_c0_g1_i1.p1 TRINITY_DN25183_c0_g1~~TRINITY_DN25183_c0_g1_i1.p1  ORF type:complete len:151 (-),score=7.83 TRINITY_DN25183_c0_g1_i1:269-721(-)